MVPDGVVDAKYCVDVARSVAAPVSDGGVAGGGVGCVHGGRAGLCRVVALRDVVAELPDGEKVARAKRGDVGGWIQGGRNLAHEGAAWVGGDARVFDGAVVSGDALVSGDAAVFGNAEVSGSARVGGEAQVFDSARVYGRAQVSGQAMVFDLSESRYYAGEDQTGALVFAPVFAQGDPARMIWTNSPAVIPDENFPSFPDQMEWVSSLSEVAERLGELGETLVPANREEWDDGVVVFPYRPTAVYGDAVVHGRARVWGGSYVFGPARVHQDGRISGQTILGGGKVCSDAWVHSVPYGGSIKCADSGGFSWVWVWVFVGLLLVVVAGWRFRRSGRSGLGFG